MRSISLPVAVRQWMTRVLLPVLVLCMVGMQPGIAVAADAYITAEFTPDATNPNNRTFTNTTPLSGLCSNPGHTAGCKAQGIWSVDTGIRGIKTTRSGGTDPRNWLYFNMPAPRTLTVRHPDGFERQMIVRITGMGFRYGDMNSSAGGAGGAMSNCQLILSNYGAGTPSAMRLFIRDDGGDGNGACWSGSYSVSSRDRPIEELDVVYSLETANPLEMAAGVYTGSTMYTIGGQGTDIDLGNGAAPDSPTLTLHFTLTVNHYFDVRFPPGSNRAVLAPVGGNWRQWTEHGRAPTALVQELPFQLSSSSHFGVTLRCEIPLADGRCAMRNRTVSSEDIPLDIRLTVPGVHDRTLGRDVVDYPLTTTMAKPLFDPQGYVYARPSRLSFKVEGDPVMEMLSFEGSHYAGDVTVIFDADL